MAEKKRAAEERAQGQEELEMAQDEVDEVLSVLRQLYQKVSSPVIKSCLEAARTDIAFLADTGEARDDDDVLLEDDLEEDDSEDEAAA